MATTLRTALSPDGSLVAVAVAVAVAVTAPPAAAAHSSSSNFRLLLFHVSTGNLQATLRLQKQKQDDDDDDEEPRSWIVRKLIFLGSSLVAGLFSDQSVVVWDLQRGVQSYALRNNKKKKKKKNKERDHYLDIVSGGGNSNAEEELLLYVLVSTKGGKLQVQKYQAGTGELQLKVKAGKINNEEDAHPGACSLSLCSDNFVIRQPETLVVLNQESGEKLVKVKSLTSPSRSECSLVVSTDTLAITLQQNGQLLGIRVPTGNRIDWGRQGSSLKLDNDGSSGGSIPLALSPSSKGSKDLLLLVDGKSLYKLVSRGGTTKEDAYEVEFMLKIASGSDVDQYAVLLPASQRSSAEANNSEHLIAVVGRSGQFQVQTLAMSMRDQQSTSDPLTVKWKDPTKRTLDVPQDEMGAATAGKRKAAAVLGPANVGGEARAVLSDGAKKSKTKKSDAADVSGSDDEDDEGDDGQAIGERLAKLRQALEEEDVDEYDDDDSISAAARQNEESGAGSSSSFSFQPKTATTESLTRFLRQAIQSNDDRMLELALDARDEKTLRETCGRLETKLVRALATAVTSRLANRPTRAGELCPWISALLKTGKIRSREHLQPLHNILQERVEVFPALLKLDGKLSMLCSGGGWR